MNTVNNPAHYGGADNAYEAIKIIEAWNLNFCMGNTLKYILRAGKKNPDKLIEDLEKALWYCDREVANPYDHEPFLSVEQLKSMKTYEKQISDLLTVNNRQTYDFTPEEKRYYDIVTTYSLEKVVENVDVSSRLQNVIMHIFYYALLRDSGGLKLASQQLSEEILGCQTRKDFMEADEEFEKGASGGGKSESIIYTNPAQHAAVSRENPYSFTVYIGKVGNNKSLSESDAEDIKAYFSDLDMDDDAEELNKALRKVFPEW